jgi:hypothetical protein
MKEILQTPEFLEIKDKYKIIFSSVEIVQKKFDIHMLVDYTGKTIAIYNLRKLKKGYEKIGSASYYCKFVSDEQYYANFGDLEKVKNSLVELIISRLELKNGLNKEN